MNQKKIGFFMKELRKEKKLTQEQMAELFGVSNKTISRWETGNNLPDISLLVQLADFYEVDIREMINGERKSGKTDEKINEAAALMADYADEKQGKLLKWIRSISIMGEICVAITLVIQTKRFDGSFSSIGLFLLSIIIFTTMTIICLYTNGLLERIAAHKKLVKTVKILDIMLIILIVRFCIQIGIVMLIAVIDASGTREQRLGIEQYNKIYYLDEYATDFGSRMLIFPKETDNMINPYFASDLHTGIFDSDGYIILQAEYSEKDYVAEIERLRSISSLIINGKEEKFTNYVLYEEEDFAYPAYLTCDGFSDMYEYALVDKENCKITYILVKYPDSDVFPADFMKYTKAEMFHKIDRGTECFSIYVHSFDDGKTFIVNDNW